MSSHSIMPYQNYIKHSTSISEVELSRRSNTVEPYSHLQECDNDSIVIDIHEENKEIKNKEKFNPFTTLTDGLIESILKSLDDISLSQASLAHRRFYIISHHPKVQTLERIIRKNVVSRN